jgi:hypothetical protein
MEPEVGNRIEEEEDWQARRHDGAAAARAAFSRL